MQIDGIRLATAAAAVKYQARDDVLLIEAEQGTQIAGIFTQSSFCAAPVQICRANLKEHDANELTYLLVNAGNANAGTGEQGLIAANEISKKLSQLQNVSNQQIFPFSTGVIGEPLPVTKIIGVLPNLVDKLAADNWSHAANAIMTTDTYPKVSKTSFEHQGKLFTVQGIAKGVGMICPNMATLLSFMATDIKISPLLLQKCLQDVANSTFNCITIDGDTSTNDSLILLATGKANNHEITTMEDELYSKFYAAVHKVALELAHLVVRDGEGATKFITINVKQGFSTDECRKVAYAIAHSPLVKTAFYAEDANWGRILMAIGKAGVSDLDARKVSLFFGDLCIAENGKRADSYDEDKATKLLKNKDIDITVNLGRGDAETTVWTCDFSHEYVSINASYRS